MSVDVLTTEQIATYKAELLEKLASRAAKSGDLVGNKSLMTALQQQGWDEQRYWDIRNRLIGDGLLAKGQGQGGSVRRVVTEVLTSQETPATSAAVEETKARESDLYEPMAKVIQSRWAQDYRMEDTILEPTALLGSKPTGKWTRPDLTLAGYKIFPYVPGKHFDLIVFEVKPAWAVDVTAVYEALGHRRAANRAYVLVHVPEDKKNELREPLTEVCSEAKRFGIGVISAAKPDDYDTWEELVEAARHDPDPERMNDFLAQQVSQGFREKIIKWFR